MSPVMFHRENVKEHIEVFMSSNTTLVPEQMTMFSAYSTTNDKKGKRPLEIVWPVPL